MNEKIEWIESEKPLKGNKDIKQIETYFQINFPQEYVGCIQEHNGAYPYPHSFKMNNAQECFNNLISADLSNKSNIIQAYESAKGIIPDDIVPFADDPFGNMICFDYRESKSNPKIVFWDYERACIEHEKPNGDYAKSVTYVCDSFSDLLDMLHEYEEE